jgi:hypothetical protein
MAKRTENKQDLLSLRATDDVSFQIAVGVAHDSQTSERAAGATDGGHDARRE